MKLRGLAWAGIVSYLLPTPFLTYCDSPYQFLHIVLVHGACQEVLQKLLLQILDNNLQGPRKTECQGQNLKPQHSLLKAGVVWPPLATDPVLHVEPDLVTEAQG